MAGFAQHPAIAPMSLPGCGLPKLSSPPTSCEYPPHPTSRRVDHPNGLRTVPPYRSLNTPLLHRTTPCEWQSLVVKASQVESHRAADAVLALAVKVGPASLRSQTISSPAHRFP